MAYPLLTRCPICEGELQATRLECTNCHGVVEGRFDLGNLLRLNREQFQFVELLVKNRGNINQVAADLGVSYTTARTRMDEIVVALGYQPTDESVERRAGPGIPSAERRDVLRRLETGEISAEEALRLLKR